MGEYNPSVAHEYDPIFQKAADTHGVSYDLLRKVAWVESRFNPKAVSPTKPRGIMQFTKATGNAYGLITDEDFFNPEKSIDAGARLLSDLIKKYDGDELKAALAYNQGGGSKSIKAYDSGNYSAISPEGSKYIKSLLDVAQSPKKGEIEAFHGLLSTSGGITPKSSKLPFPEVEIKQGAVTDDIPQSTPLDIKGVESEPPREPFSKTYWEAQQRESDNEKSTWFGFADAVQANISNSLLGVAFRAATTGGWDLMADALKPARFNEHIWSPEELERIRTEVKNADYINVVLGGNSDTLDDLIKLANRNYELDVQASNAGLGAQIAGGLVGAAVDPVTYIPIIGQTGKGVKLVSKVMKVAPQAAALNVASEALRTSVAGGNPDYEGAAISGALLASGLTFIADTAAKGFSKIKNAKELENNPFLGTQIRLEARETARNTDGFDRSRLPPDDNRKFSDYNGVEYSPLETEDGAVVLRDGSIISDTNLANPQTAKEFAEVDPERAARGVSLGGLTELGYKTNRSDNVEVRKVASDLVRPTTGTESGSNGKFGATASDIKDKLRNVNQRVYNDLFKAMKEVLKDPEFSVGVFKFSKAGARQEVYKRVSLAIEHPELQANLTKAERKVMDILKDHFDYKRDRMEHPTIYGNEATSIFPESHFRDTYVPHVYSREAKLLYTQELGADGLQKAIVESWLTSYRSRPKVKERVDKGIAQSLGIEPNKVTEEMVNDYATRKAYGIAKTDEFTSASILEENINGLSGIENNQFLEARNLFDSDMSITLPSGQDFSVNNLRDFDLKHILPAYDRRVDGDIAIMGGTGKTTLELKNEILALEKKAKNNGKLKSEVDALKEIMKILTGRARRNQDTIGETAVRALSDFSFFTKNAYMGLQNLTEISGMLAKGNIRAMLHGIPKLRELSFKKKPVSGQELKDLHSMVFGREFDQTIRPTRQDIIQRLRDSTDASNLTTSIVGTIKYGTQELAARSPFTKFLNGSANYILDMGRQGVLGDIITHSLTGKGAEKWISDGMLRSASITKEQWAGIQNLIRENVKLGEDGKYTFINKRKLEDDPRTMDLWRMADKVADETMLRPHKVSYLDSKSYSAAAKLVLQFKSFTIKSLNAKFIRSGYEAFKNKRAMDTALTYALSLGIAGSYYVAQAHIKAAGLPEEQQKEYLKKALDPKMITYAALSRSSHVGAPLGLANYFMGAMGYDQGSMVRSTILPKSRPEVGNEAVTSHDEASKLLNGIGEQVPAVNVVGSLLSAGKNAYSYAVSPNKLTEMEMLNGLMNAHRELIPNDPISQQLLIQFYQQNGVYLNEKKKKKTK